MTACTSARTQRRRGTELCAAGRWASNLRSARPAAPRRPSAASPGGAAPTAQHRTSTHQQKSMRRAVVASMAAVCACARPAPANPTTPPPAAQATAASSSHGQRRRPRAVDLRCPGRPSSVRTGPPGPLVENGLSCRRRRPRRACARSVSRPLAVSSRIFNAGRRLVGAHVLVCRPRSRTARHHHVQQHQRRALLHGWHRHGLAPSRATSTGGLLTLHQELQRDDDVGSVVGDQDLAKSWSWFLVGWSCAAR